MSDPDTPAVVSLPSLLLRIMTGRISAAMFQRQFVWDDTQRLELLDSVARQRPIGALFLWVTPLSQHDLATYDMLGPVRVLRREKNPPYPEYLVDGLQRATTLYAALAPGLVPTLLRDRKKYGVLELPKSGEAIFVAKALDGRTREQWEIFLDVADDESDDRFKLRTGRMLRSGKLPPSWVSLSQLFDPDAIRAIEARESFALKPLWKDCLRRHVDILTEAKIVLIPMVTDSEEEAVAAYTRINRGGTPMDETQLVHAKIWQRTKGKVDLLRLLVTLREKLSGYGYDDLKDAVLLNSLILSSDGRIQVLKHRDEEKVATMLGNHGSDGIEKAERALVRASSYLHEHLLVRGSTMLPSNWHLLFLVLVADRLDTNDIVQRLRIWRWFMATTYLGVLSTNLRVQEELDWFVQQAVNPQAPGHIYRHPAREPISPVQSAGRFDLRSSRNKAFALWLVWLASKYGQNDVSVRLSHLLGREGMRALPHLVEDEDLTLPEARVLLDPADLAGLRLNLLRDPAEVTALLARHAISSEAHSAFQVGDTATFVRERRKTIDAGEREFVKDLGLTWLPDERLEA